METLYLLGMRELAAAKAIFPNHTLQQTQAVLSHFNLVHPSNTSPQTMYHAGAC